MDYYEPNRPPVDDSGLSGGVSFQLAGKIAVSTYRRDGFQYQSQSSRRSSRSSGGRNTYTLTICVNGVPKLLDVYASGEPRDP